jgi:3-oxoacyl-[acyl-carrier-protein] synthase II
VLVTGVGAVTPYGVGVDAFWHGCVAGESAVTALRIELDGLTCRSAGQVDIDVARHLSKVEARRLVRFCQFALIAAREALDDASLDISSIDASRAGVCLGNGSGAFSQAQSALDTVREKGWALLNPLVLVAALPDMATANLSIALGTKGPMLTFVASCSSGTVAIAQALDLIRSGRADVVIAGGTEAWLTPLGIASFAVLRALSTRPCPPEEASCPFDAKRDGFVPGEGAGVVVLESEAHAQKRGARVYCELAGAALTADGHHLVAPLPDGRNAMRCMTEALADASVAPQDVDHINAHGTSTPLNDTAEAAAIRSIWPGGRRPLVSSTKSLIGHTMGAAGAIETLAAIKAIHEGIVPPGINLTDLDPQCDLNHVGPEARRTTVSVVLKNSFAFGGQNASLVLRSVSSRRHANPDP